MKDHLTIAGVISGFLTSDGAYWELPRRYTNQGTIFQ
jgi:hypothetical protein